jgi:hypothetical protein
LIQWEGCCIVRSVSPTEGILPEGLPARFENRTATMAKQQKSIKPKITIIPGKGVAQTINYLLKDRDDLDWLVAVGRNKDGEIFFYDTGGDIIEDLGTLEYLKERITRAHFGDEPE